jgi:hypothetical protein
MERPAAPPVGLYMGIYRENKRRRRGTTAVRADAMWPEAEALYAVGDRPRLPNGSYRDATL